jgi:predicted RNA binding protein YcfA (HicA-like mRNA interferase family)
VSKLAKLVAAFLASPVQVSFDDVERLMRAFGFKIDRTTGSHHVFRHDDGSKLTVPTVGGRRVKSAYVRQIVDLLNLEKWHED